MAVLSAKLHSVMPYANKTSDNGLNESDTGGWTMDVNDPTVIFFPVRNRNFSGILEKMELNILN